MFMGQIECHIALSNTYGKPIQLYSYGPYHMCTGDILYVYVTWSVKRVIYIAFLNRLIITHYAFIHITASNSAVRGIRGQNFKVIAYLQIKLQVA